MGSLNTKRFILGAMIFTILDSILEYEPHFISRYLLAKDAGEVEKVPSLGAHYVTLYVGRPVQPQRLIVSLGSEFTSFPCMNCENCGDHHAGKYFDFKNSSVHMCPDDCAFRKSRCEDGSQQCMIVSSQYLDEDMEGGFRGFEVQDYVSLLRPTKTSKKITKQVKGFPMDFVCETQLRGMTQDLPGDGLLALSAAPSAFINQMYNQGLLKARMFSLCFNRMNGKQARDASLGTVHFDEIHREYHSSALVWARSTGKETSGYESYAVRINNLHLGIGGGRTPLIHASMGTMSTVTLGSNVSSFSPPEEWLRDAKIQSNRPITQLPLNFEKSFVDEFRKISGVAFDSMGISVSKASLRKFPTLFLQIEPHLRTHGRVRSNIPGFAGHLDPNNPYDIVLAVPPEHYVYYNERTGIAIPTVTFSDKMTFIGANVLQGHDLVFDIDNDRVGFAETQACQGKSKGKTISVSQDRDTRTVNSDKEAVSSQKDSRGSHGLESELDNHGATNRAKHQKGRSIGGNITEGIPLAIGQSHNHAGPGAIAAEAKLNAVNSKQALTVDLFHIAGITLLIISFGITAFATRDKVTNKRDKKFNESSEPLLDENIDDDKQLSSSSRRSLSMPYKPPFKSSAIALS
jgi:Xylanase inhibitor N-terminal